MGAKSIRLRLQAFCVGLRCINEVPGEKDLLRPDKVVNKCPNLNEKLVKKKAKI